MSLPAGLVAVAPCWLAVFRWVSAAIAIGAAAMTSAANAAPWITRSFMWSLHISSQRVDAASIEGQHELAARGSAVKIGRRLAWRCRSPRFAWRNWGQRGII